MTAGSWRAVAAGLALGLVATVAGLVVVLTGDDDGASGTSSAATEALALQRAETGAEKAARTAAVDLTSYDHETLDEDFAWVEDAGTTKFQEQYAKVSAPVRKAVTELEAHAEGSVQASAATAQDVDHVTVLLFVDQTLTSAANPERRLVTPRITMTMVREDGRWLVDEVELNDQAD